MRGLQLKLSRPTRLALELARLQKIEDWLQDTAIDRLVRAEAGSLDFPWATIAAILKLVQPSAKGNTPLPQ